MKKVVKTSASSYYIGNLPKGCKLCMEGSKLVIFVTGLCSHPEKCESYCPISEERKNKDLSFANDRPVNSIEDIFIEAKNMDARGAGITGGDPLFKLDRTLDYIKIMKNNYGNDFHIHLYCSTSPYLTFNNLKLLKDAGLDEIRFHVDKEFWHLMVEAKKIGLTVGAEVPAINLEELKMLGKFLNANKLDFLNINELEFSETNADSLKKKGYKLKKDSLVAVDGSEKIALEFLDWALINLTLDVHFCTVTLKDGFQFKNRMLRVANKIARQHEVVTEEGLLLFGIIPWKDKIQKAAILNLIKENFEISDEFINQNDQEQRIEIYWEILDESYQIFKNNNLECGIIQLLPDYKKTIIRYDPY
ncbi:MAG: radical SAM protein [Candidatus Helarchaeota archaeon]